MQKPIAVGSLAAAADAAVIILFIHVYEARIYHS